MAALVLWQQLIVTGAMTPKIVTIWTFIENITSLYLSMHPAEL